MSKNFVFLFLFNSEDKENIKETQLPKQETNNFYNDLGYGYRLDNPNCPNNNNNAINN